jgi:biotin transport system substrate-specific component
MRAGRGKCGGQLAHCLKTSMGTYSMTTQRTATLIDAWWPSSGTSLAKNAAIVVLGSLLLTLSAKVKVPIEPVPVTMQLFVVLALSLALGARLATATVFVYLAQGAAGLPVFTGTPEKGIGIAYMMGFTGGYLAGFLIAAGVVGWLADRGFSRHVLLALVAVFLGAAIIHGAGLLWAGFLLNWSTSLLSAFFWPFVGADVVKAALAGLIVPAAWALTRKRPA